MNTTLEIPTTENPAPAPTPATQASYRAKGKIAKLPKEQRDLVNNLLRDGNTYAGVCEKLGELGVSLNAENVSNWHNGPGFQDWLFYQEWREDTRDLRESALELSGDSDTPQFNKAALHLATLQIFAALRHLPGGKLEEKLGGDSSAFSRLVNALSRATRETLNTEKYIAACAAARAALEPMKDPRRKLTESERRAIVRHVDQILGFAPEDEPDGWPPGSTPTAPGPQGLSAQQERILSLPSTEAPPAPQDPPIAARS